MRRLAGIVLLILCSSWYHPIHVSVTNVDLDPAAGTIDLSVKIFADDFQDLILQKYAVQLKITQQVKPAEKIGAVNRYMDEALQMEINGQEIRGMEFVGSELNEEAIWLRYHYRHKGAIRKIMIRNSIMLEMFDDQTNLMILAYDGKQNGYRLDNKTTELALNIKK